ncbi:MAG: hypothetical protein ACPL4N_03825, partial [Candidatus Norongarragalinales archaeon]
LYGLLYVENIVIKLVSSPLFVEFNAKRINFMGLFFDTYKFFFLFVLWFVFVFLVGVGVGCKEESCEKKEWE